MAMPENVNTSVLASDQLPAEEEDNRPVMIDVDHVSMSFNMASEQLNNLKEYAIAIARGKLFFEEFKALDDVSFQVRKGDVFGIMGTNGSGKSTILKIIAGVLEPSKGKCTVNGNIAPLIELGAGFDMDLSARENIYLNGALLGYSKEFINEHFDEIVEFAEVEKFLDMPLKNYSSGMVSRIAFAIATVIVPEILVVDEVLSVGDFMFQRKCENRITQLIEEHGVTVLIVSHSNDQIARLCNKAIWIEKGHTRLMGDAGYVARIYGGLGGRTGSKESEERVFDSLKTALAKDENELKDYYSIAEGESPASRNNRMTLRFWKGRKACTACLVGDSTHANAVVASGFAGALEAPVIVCGGNEKLSESAEHALLELRPETIYVFRSDGPDDKVISQLEACSWNPTVLSFGQGATATEISQESFSYGRDNDLWANEAYVVGFADNSQSLLLSPMAYAKHAPAFVLNPWQDDCSAVVALLQSANISCITLVGPSVMKFKEEFVAAGLTVSLLATGDGDTCFEVFDAVFNTIISSGQSGDGMELMIASRDFDQWPELLTIGCCAGSGNSALMMMDKTNLDSEAVCLKYLESHSAYISKLLFVGGRLGLGAEEQSMLASSIA